MMLKNKKSRQTANNMATFLLSVQLLSVVIGLWLMQWLIRWLGLTLDLGITQGIAFGVVLMIVGLLLVPLIPDHWLEVKPVRALTQALMSSQEQALVQARSLVLTLVRSQMTTLAQALMHSLKRGQWLKLGRWLTLGLVLGLMLGLLQWLLQSIALGVVLGQLLVLALAIPFIRITQRLRSRNQILPTPAKISHLNFVDIASTKLTQLFPDSVSHKDRNGMVITILDTCEEAFECGGIGLFHLKFIREILGLLWSVTRAHVEPWLQKVKVIW